MGAKDTEVGIFEDGMYAVGKGGFTSDPIQNSVDEIKVVTGTPPAEYGHSSGGAITVIKKSGTNELHGNFNDFGRYGKALFAGPDDAGVLYVF